MRGKVGESILQAYLELKGWTITSATKQEQLKEGIDFKVAKGDKHYSLEVKTEYSAERTGNVFWEMEVDGKPGWTQKYQQDSDVLVCTLLPIRRVVYMYFAKSLPRITQYIKDNFEGTKRVVTNTHYRSGKTYLSWGYLLPLEHLSKFSKMYKI